MKKDTIAGTETIIVHGAAAAKKHVVLLHGYGANNADLAPIAETLSPHLPGITWLLPNGFEPLENLPFAFEGRQWFALDRSNLERYFLTKNYAALGRLFAPALDNACERLLRFLKAADVPLQDIILAGFSQGAMLASHVALRLPASPSGLIALSGIFLPENGWEAAAPLRKKMPVFQAHGIKDQVLPFELAKLLVELWRASDVPIEFVPFQGGHEIPPEVLQGLKQFLQRQVGASNEFP